MAVISGGTLMFQTFELLPRDEAWLVSGVTAALLIFAIPEENKKRHPKDLIFLFDRCHWSLRDLSKVRAVARNCN